MPWQTQVAVQLQAGNTIINANGTFVYSSAPAAGNLIASNAPTLGTDQYGNHYLANTANYSATLAVSLTSASVQFYSGSLSAGWTLGAIIQTDAFGDILLVPAAGRSVSTSNNTLDNGSGSLTVSSNLTVSGTLSSLGGSTSVGAADNGGVTSGPSGTVSSFPAAGPNHTHAMAHHHPYHA